MPAAVASSDSPEPLARKLTRWLALLLVTLPNLAATVMTLTHAPEVVGNYERWGYPAALWPPLAAAYTLGAALLWFRLRLARTLGAVLLSAVYVDNARHHFLDRNPPHLVFAIIVIGLAWFLVAAGRRPLSGATVM